MLELTTAGVFLQNKWKPNEKFIVETGIQVDNTNQQEIFVPPRISAMFKFNKHFTSCVGGGFGCKTSDIFTEDLEEKNFRRIQPLRLSIVKPERSVGFNVDLNYRGEIADAIILTVNHLFFLTRVSRPLLLETYQRQMETLRSLTLVDSCYQRGLKQISNLLIAIGPCISVTLLQDAARNFDDESVNPLTAKHISGKYTVRQMDSFSMEVSRCTFSCFSGNFIT
jgi:outer membrane receptor for ferrienterochelin and colicins